MGIITTAHTAQLIAMTGQAGLRTPLPNKEIAAATAGFSPGPNGKMEAFVTIVTMDGKDLMGLPKKRLAEAEAVGFDGVVVENSRWWSDFYDHVRTATYFIVYPVPCTEDIRAGSYSDSHDGGTKTDMAPVSPTFQIRRSAGRHHYLGQSPALARTCLECVLALLGEFPFAETCPIPFILPTFAVGADKNLEFVPKFDKNHRVPKSAVLMTNPLQ